MILDRVDILLSTYNGEEYIKEQLDSIFTQTYKNFRLIVRDDGSSDGTLDIIKKYDVELLEAHENLGAKMSFAALLEYALNSSNSRYFMFADQDDVWDSDKVQKSIDKIKEFEKEQVDSTPLLVHSDLRVVDENLKIMDNSFWHYSQIDPAKNSLNRLLIQNTVTGCTMLINRELAYLSLPMAPHAIMHDWWIALVAAKFGEIVSLKEPTMNYRQHSSNDTGAKGFTVGYIVQKALSSDSIIKYQLQAKAFLEHYQAKLDSHTQEMLLAFSQIEQCSRMQKIALLFKYSFFKQGAIRNLGLMLKV